MRGGLKGKMAPGDAHPYLAPFYFRNLSAPDLVIRSGAVLGAWSIRARARSALFAIRTTALLRSGRGAFQSRCTLFRL